MNLVILNWVGIGVAIAVIPVYYNMRGKVPWWVALIWLGIIIASKIHILKLL